MVLQLCYLNICSLNIVNRKRICVRSLHFKSQETKAPTMYAVNICFKQTGLNKLEFDKYVAAFARMIGFGLTAITLALASIINSTPVVY